LHVKFWDKLHVNTVYYYMTGAIQKLGCSTSVTIKKDFAWINHQLLMGLIN